MSIGITRLFFQLKEANIIKTEESSLTKVLIIPMKKDFIKRSLEVGNSLRTMNISTQIYLESGKVGKKFNYADKLNLPYVIIIGEEEIEKDLYALRRIGRAH